MTKPASQTPQKIIPAFFRILWWLSVFLAIASYYCLKYIAPKLQFTDHTLQSMAAAAPGLAPIAAIVFLLLAAFRLYDGDDEESTEDMDKLNDSDN